MVARGPASRKSKPADPADRSKPVLLSVRSALVILLALLVALGGGGLLYLANRSGALAVFTACGVFALGLKFFNDLIELPAPHG